MGKRGPKKIQVEWDKVDKMCAIQCTAEEIAGFFGFSVDTLERRCKDDHSMKLADYIAQKREGGKASLRRKQWLMAEKNPTMAIFLGKQYLGQADKMQQDHTTKGNPIVFQVVEKQRGED